jgi:hypothetical protein
MSIVVTRDLDGMEMRARILTGKSEGLFTHIFRDGRIECQGNDQVLPKQATVSATDLDPVTSRPEGYQPERCLRRFQE